MVLRLLLLLCVLGAAWPARAQAPAPGNACTAADWPAFWGAIREARSVERRRMALPDMESTSARTMPDGIAQRLRVEGSFVPSAQYFAVWLYPGSDRIAGTGRDARTEAGQRGVRLAVGVPRQPADSPGAWDATITIPAVGSEALPRRGFLTQAATLVVVGCAREGDRAEFLATAEFNISDGRMARALAVAAVVLIYAAAALVAHSGRRRRSDLVPAGAWAALHPVVVTQDAMGRGSLSRLQILFFTLIVVGTLFYLFLRTGVVANLSADLLWLLGISGAGTVLAQAVSANRHPRGAIAFESLTWLAAHGVLREGRVPRWRDLFFSGGEFDIYKLQNMVFSPFVGLTVMAAGVSDLAALEIPDNLMALLGLSQVVYVGGKAVQAAPGAEAIDAAVAAAAAAEGKVQAAYAATCAAGGPAATQAEALGRVPAEAVAFRAAARVAADAFAHNRDEDIQVRTPAPLLVL